MVKNMIRKIVTFDKYLEDMSDEEFYRLQSEYHKMSIGEQYQWVEYIDEFLEIENLDEYDKEVLEKIDKLWWDNNNLLKCELTNYIDEVVDSETAMIYLIGYIL